MRADISMLEAVCYMNNNRGYFSRGYFRFNAWLRYPA